MRLTDLKMRLQLPVRTLGIPSVLPRTWAGLSGKQGFRTGAIPCARLCSCVAGMLWGSKSIPSELRGRVPALTLLCSYTLTTCCCILTLTLAFVFAVAHLTSLNVCLEPACTPFLVCKAVLLVAGFETNSKEKRDSFLTVLS